MASRIFVQGGRPVGFGGGASASIIEGLAQGVTALDEQEQKRRQQAVLNRLSMEQIATQQQARDHELARENRLKQQHENKMLMDEMAIREGRASAADRARARARRLEMDRLRRELMEGMAPQLMGRNPGMDERTAQMLSEIWFMGENGDREIATMMYSMTPEDQAGDLQNIEAVAALEGMAAVRQARANLFDDPLWQDYIAEVQANGPATQQMEALLLEKHGADLGEHTPALLQDFQTVREYWNPMPEGMRLGFSTEEEFQQAVQQESMAILVEKWRSIEATRRDMIAKGENPDSAVNQLNLTREAMASIRTHAASLRNQIADKTLSESQRRMATVGLRAMGLVEERIMQMILQATTGQDPIQLLMQRGMGVSPPNWGGFYPTSESPEDIRRRSQG
jgi:hypothetical protein